MTLFAYYVLVGLGVVVAIIGLRALILALWVRAGNWLTTLFYSFVAAAGLLGGFALIVNNIGGIL